jgi:hypothetical protein
VIAAEPAAGNVLGVTIDGQDRMAVDGMLTIVRRLAEAAPEIPAAPVN